MSMIVDLQESEGWLAASQWPSWLTSDWLSENDARLVCRLTHPDDLTALRAIAPLPERLLAYPDYSVLQQHLERGDRDKLHRVFLQCLGAEQYVTIAPGSSPPTSPIRLESRLQQGKLESCKPQLAFVSPLPPAASGVAGYCAEILPYLAENYDITLVVANPEDLDHSLASMYETIDHKQMMRDGGRFDRVMYHFGNSWFHYEYFLLLQAHPGVVVLHDAYLGHCIISNHAQFGTTELLQKVYASHGWAAMPDCDGPVKQTINLYPACASVFNGSYGVVVHNRHAKEILYQSLEPEMLTTLGEVPLARQLKRLPDRSAARQELGIPEEITLYSTFGMINPNKCLVELMDSWVSSGLANNPSVKLYFVGGGNRDWEMENRISNWISRLPDPQQVTLTGYVSSEEYDLYLGASDVALQLRRNSRGESSAALLDCMGAGLPTIINAHGSMSEVPDETVLKLNDDFTASDLAEALTSFATDTESRREVGRTARAYVKAHHSPATAASAYRDHMEASYIQSPDVLIDQLQADIIGSKLRELPADKIFACSDAIEDLMRCAGVRRTALAGSQLFVDISSLVQHDHQRGVQRVVRNILRELLLNRYLGYRVEPIFFDSATGYFLYARAFTNRFLHTAPLHLSDDTVEAMPGDIYLGLDLCYRVAQQADSRQWLQFWRGRGVRICHVVYDLLPVSLAEGFTSDEITVYTNWLTAITAISDRVACPSRTVAHEYRQWLQSENSGAPAIPVITEFQLGADMEARSGGGALNATEQALLEKLQHQPYLLMAGGITPRKGHEQVVEAFNELQRQGCRLSLVIAGSIDENHQHYADRIQQLGDGSSSIYWVGCVSDAMLKVLYQRAAGTLLASSGEGFSLSLLEAAYHGSALLVRNLPVFREICGEYAWYFDATDSTGLATEIKTWFGAYRDGVLPDSSWIQSVDWQRSAAQLANSVIPARALSGRSRLL
ncbi:MAG: glycosyltransferase [Halioglobus sp.]|nr:glycosyltransferase [Halioglobus sp.]